MATTPLFTSGILLGTASLSVGNTARDNTNTNIVDAISTAQIPAAGARISRIVIQSAGRPADSTVLMFVHNGTIYQLVNDFDIGAPVASSATVSAFHLEIPLVDFDVPNGFKIGFAVTVTPTTGVLLAHAFGGVYT